MRLLAQVLRESGRIAAREIEAGGDDERGDAEAGDGGSEEDDAACGQNAPLLRWGIRSGNDARVHRKFSIRIEEARLRAVSTINMERCALQRPVERINNW